MSTVTLRLLGTFSLQADPDGNPVRLGRKGEALVAHMAAHGAAGVTRSAAIALLWPDHPEEDARTSLRQCLHRMRGQLRHLPGLLDTDGDRLVVSPSCDVDLWQFERLAAQDDPASLLGAAQMYRGAFCEGLGAGREWERWLAAQRQRVAALAHRVLAGLADTAAAPAEYAAGIALAQRLLADDPVHEGCYRALMLLHERAGERATALRVWEQCRRTLRVELNVEPCAQTRELYSRLREASAESNDERTALPPWATLIRRGPSLAQELPGPTPTVDHMLRGWQLFTHFHADTNPLARAAFEAAVAADPLNVGALTLVGFTHLLDFVSGWTNEPEHSFQLAQRAADRALAIGGDHPAPHTLHGKLLLWRKEYDAALAELRRTVSRADSLASVHFHLGDICIFAGEYEESLRHIRRALQLEPNDHGLFLTIEGFALLALADLEGARAACTSAIDRNPTYAWPYGILAVALMELGDADCAQQAATTARRFCRRLSVDFAEAGLPLRDAGLRTRVARAWAAAGMPQHEGAQPAIFPAAG